MTKANPPAKKAPTIQEKIIGSPSPPKNPVLAGFTSSIASIPGSEINRIIKEPKLSVVDKPFPVNVKNYKTKNDYFSVAPYWWPLIKEIRYSPYIWKDGKRNPESILFSKESKCNDRTNLHLLFERISKLSIFYLKEKDNTCLEYLSEQLNTWFILKSKKMNPNLNFAQVKRGILSLIHI